MLCSQLGAGVERSLNRLIDGDVIDGRVSHLVCEFDVTIQPEFVQDPTAVGGGSATTAFFVTKPLRLTR